MMDVRDVDEVIKQATLGQIMHRLPPSTASWVQCHYLSLLAPAIELAKDHLTVAPGAGKPHGTLSVSSLPPMLPFCTCPSSRVCSYPYTGPEEMEDYFLPAHHANQWGRPSSFNPSPSALCVFPSPGVTHSSHQGRG